VFSMKSTRLPARARTDITPWCSCQRKSQSIVETQTMLRWLGPRTMQPPYPADREHVGEPRSTRVSCGQPPLLHPAAATARARSREELLDSSERSAPARRLGHRRQRFPSSRPSRFAGSLSAGTGCRRRKMHDRRRHPSRVTEGSIS
jgi:hypothetical protein